MTGGLAGFRMSSRSDILTGQSGGYDSRNAKNPNPDENGRPIRAADKQYYSRAVAKALQVLDLLSAASQPLSLHEMASMVKLTKTSLFRLLYTLEAEGAVDKDAGGHYSLKSNPAKQASRVHLEKVLELGSAQFRDLVREFRETASLAFLFDNHIEVIAVVESPQIVRMGNTVGRILQPHASSLGKCITAFQREERREHLIRSYGISAITPQTICR
jgi:DNA-binding IclR family transcriptional regulator